MIDINIISIIKKTIINRFIYSIILVLVGPVSGYNIENASEKRVNLVNNFIFKMFASILNNVQLLVYLNSIQLNKYQFYIQYTIKYHVLDTQVSAV